MARLYNCGFEMQSTTANMEFNATSTAGGSAVAISTSIKRSGNAAIRFSNSGANGGAYARQDLLADGNGPYYFRAYVYVADRPSARTSLLTVKNIADTSRMYVDLNTDGTLTLADTSGDIGTSSALALSTWYRVELKFFNNTVSGKAEMDVMIDGTSFASTTTSTSTGTVGRLRFGPSDSVSSYDIYMDDIAINDNTGSAQTSWCGEGKLVLALPTGAGDNAATTGVYSYINEIPPSDTATSGSTMVELDANPTIGDYNMTDSSTLGICTTDTISMIQVMSRMREETSGATNYTLRIKSASGGTTTSSSSLDVGDTTPRTNPSGTTVFGNVLISYTDPTTAAAWTPTGTNSIDNMQVGVGTTDGNPDTWCLWLGAYIEYVPVGIAIDTYVNSGVKASVSNYTFDIGIANQSNKAVAILASCRDNDNPTNRPITGITVGGVAATYVGGISSTDGDGDDIRAEGWLILAPSNGVNTVSVTHTGTVDHAGAVAVALYNAYQSTTAEATGTDEDTQSSATTNPDTTVTTTKVNCLVFDAIYHQDGANLTVGSGQNAIVQLGTNGGGDRAVFSSKLATASGATHMQWTAGTMDAFCQFAMAIASYSATGTSVMDIIGSGMIPFAR